MKLTIQGVRSLKAAAIAITPPLTVIAGGNGTGKTTAYRLLQELLGQTSGLPRSKAGRAALVSDGLVAATVRLEDADWQVELSLPDAERTGSGRPETCGDVALGRQQLAHMTAEERSRYLADVLRARPSQAELKAAAEQAELPAKMVPGAVEAWDAAAWDGAAKDAEATARRFKGDWCRVVQRQSYGAKLAETWQPSGTTLDLSQVDHDDLQRDIGDAKLARDAALKRQAVSDADRERMAEKASGAEAIETAIARMESALVTGRAQRDAKKDTISKTALSRALCPCPHCKQPVEIWPEEDIGQPLRKPGRHAAVDAKTMASWRTELAELEKAVKEGEEELVRLRANLADAKAAAEKLANLPPPSDELGEAERRLAELEALHTAYAKFLTARTLHEEIGHQLKLAELLGPSGLRKRKLRETISLFNGRLDELCLTAQWPVVAIDETMEVRVGQRHFADLSESEQWRAEVILALAIATIDGSPVVLLDRADVLDSRGRNGLLKLLRRLGRTAVACMTLPIAQAEKLADAGIPVFWLENGQARCLTAEPLARAG